MRENIDSPCRHAKVGLGRASGLHTNPYLRASLGAAMNSATTVLPDPVVLATASSLLATLDQLFNAAVAQVAAQCAKNGKLDGGRLDEKQWASYELSLAGADLLAARTLLDAGENGTALDRALAIAFATEAVIGVASRLQGVYAAAGMDAGELDALVCGEALRELRRAASPDALALPGAAV